MQVMGLLGFCSIISVLLKNLYAQRAITPVKTLTVICCIDARLCIHLFILKVHFRPVLVRKLLIYECICIVACK